MNAPCTFSLKNDGISQFFDVSYLDFQRKGDTTQLKQEQSSAFLSMFNKVKETPDFINRMDKLKFSHDMHQLKKAKAFAEKEANKKLLNASYVEKTYNPRQLGTLSNNAKKSCAKACELMINTVLYSRQKDVDFKSQQYLVFLTLTLPSKQVHSDKVLRRALTKYIDNLRKNHGVKFYVWRAEPQNNGNIHFHLLLDKFIEKDDIRRLWNKQLSKLGYLDAFQKVHGHRNPPSTRIESYKVDKKGKKISNPTKYITKYMTKLKFGQRPIIGRIWGASKEVKALQYPRYAEGDKYFDHVISMINKTGKFKQVISEDFFSYFSGKTFEVLRSTYKQLYSDVKNFFKLQNGNLTPKTLQHKEFIRLEKDKDKPKPKKEPVISTPTPKIDPIIIEQLQINYGNRAYWSNNVK